jgi:hypothetical protein
VNDAPWLSAGLIRIWDRDGKVAGAGFLISDRIALTCAHVVAQALGRPAADAGGDGDLVSVDFALIREAAFRIQLASVTPIPLSRGRRDVLADAVALRLEGPLPEGARPLPLSLDSAVMQHPFTTFGFPSVSPHENGDWADGIIQGLGSAGLLQIRSGAREGRRVQRGFSGAPVWDTTSGRVAGMVTEADRGGDDRVAYAIPAWDLGPGLGEIAETAACPYRGLEPFRREDSELFFGRDEFTERLVKVTSERPLLAVTGLSGSGKSSVVAAGLAARLSSSRGWHVVSMRPGKEPFSALAQAMLPLLEPGLTPVEQLDKTAVLAAVLRRDGLTPALGVARRSGNAPLLLIVDQFEELFVLSPEDDTRAFIEVLVKAAERPHDYRSPDYCMVLTLRTEFLAEALGHPGLDAVISPVEVLGSMTREQLRRAVEQPLRNSSVRFADDLVQRILLDTPDIGQLPLVQFLLASLWDHQEGLRLTHSAYQQLGGVGGALARHAEQVYNLLLPDEQQRARAILVRLVTARNQSDPATCRVADRAEFEDTDWGLIEHLANQRLLLTSPDQLGQRTVQIVHEALLSKWERLSEWIAEDREHFIAEAEFRDAATHWKSNERDTSRLLRGKALSDAERWIHQISGDTDPLIVEFVLESLMAETRLYSSSVRMQKLGRAAEWVSDTRLNIESLDAVIAYHLSRWQPVRAYGYWRQLWQYEDSIPSTEEGIRTRVVWRRATGRAPQTVTELTVIALIWLTGWFWVAYLVEDAVQHDHYDEVVTMAAAGVITLIALRLTRNGFAHPLLFMPVALTWALFSVSLVHFGAWTWLPSGSVTQSAAVGAGFFAAQLAYLTWRSRSRRKHGQQAKLDPAI